MLSLIIPVFNEAPNLQPLYGELKEALSRLHQAAEILFVDDASTDRTSDAIRGLQATDPRIRGFRLHQNSDKGGALAVGFREARGDILVTMDGDLQNDPADIPLLLQAFAEGADLATGWRRERADPPGKRLASACFNIGMSCVFRHRLHDANTGFKALRKETALTVPLTQGLFRFLPFILARRGMTIREVPVHHRPRRNGRTKFRLSRRASSLRKLRNALRAASTPLTGLEGLPAYETL
ncbi:MAG: glycosyltransferase family 2 protein [Candidatus Peribacteraceae bacterium]|nr:glycosyltransferase family 2 protein [Candidatus Peribacteraceae bacterium]